MAAEEKRELMVFGDVGRTEARPPGGKRAARAVCEHTSGREGFLQERNGGQPLAGAWVRSRRWQRRNSACQG